MIDSGAELGGLLLDVVQSLSDGLFRARDLHLVGLVTLSLMVVLDHFGPIYLALLLGTIYAIMAGHEPSFAQTLVLVIVEAARPVALPFFCQHHPWSRHGLLVPHHRDRRTRCCLRRLGGEQPFNFDVHPIPRPACAH
jgi:hypothetical protein